MLKHMIIKYLLINCVYIVYYETYIEILFSNICDYDFYCIRIAINKESYFFMKFGWDEKENRNWILMGVIFGAVEWCVTLPYRVVRFLYRIAKSLYKYLTKS